LGERFEIKSMLELKCRFTDRMLLTMVMLA